jgi:hypothetical protein
MTGWTTPLRAGAFALGLLVVLGLGALAGRAVGPIEVTASAEHGHETDGDQGSHDGHADTLPAGLAVSDAGYTLVPAQSRLHAGGAVPVAFRITGPDGHPVTAFDTVHDKTLHLIAIRRDLTGFQYVHPTMDAHGRWTTALELTPGPWRLLADFRPTGGTATTLGVDVQTAGHYDPAAPAPTSRVATVGDYTVHLDGRLVAGGEAELTLTVSRAGRPVTDLQPYLGAYGHLVALREGDLAYLHVHPEGEPGDGTTRPGPAITFRAHVPTAGAYRLFLDFRHHNVVRTAEFALSAPNGHGDDQHQEGHEDADH